MKAVSAKDLKQILANSSQQELVDICLRLARFKKENKELLTYLLFEAHDEHSYVYGIKEEIDRQFLELNRKTPYLLRKSVRRIQLSTKKFIKYSPKKETEVELLIYFCSKVANLKPSIRGNTKLYNIYKVQIASIEKKIEALHEDLQFDFNEELNELEVRY